MNIEDYMLYMLETYINNEIENLYLTIDLEKNEEIKKDLEKDIKMLENLSIEEKNKIAEKCVDDELKNKLYENMNYYLYHREEKENE